MIRDNIYLTVTKKELKDIKQNGLTEGLHYLKRRPNMKHAPQGVTDVLVIKVDDLNYNLLENVPNEHLVQYDGYIAPENIYLNTTNFINLKESNWKQRPFKVVQTLDNSVAEEYLSGNKETKHIKDREERESIYEEFNLYDANVKGVFEVDRKHWNGNEVHIVFDTGLVVMYNAKDGNRISVIFPRKGQILRYFEDGNVPNDWLRLANHVGSVNKKHNLNKK